MIHGPSNVKLENFVPFPAEAKGYLFLSSVPSPNVQICCGSYTDFYLIDIGRTSHRDKAAGGEKLTTDHHLLLTLRKSGSKIPLTHTPL